MTENGRRRISKWDVITEPNSPGEIAQNSDYLKTEDISKKSESQTGLRSISHDDKQFPTRPNMKSDDTFRRDISQEDENKRPSEGFSHKNEPLNWVDMEQDEAKYPFNKPDYERLTVKEMEISRVMGDQDLTSNQKHSSVMSAGFTEWRRHSHNISPRVGRTRSGRSRSRSWSRGRSRSRSRSNSHNRSRSPFYHRGGSERSSGRGIRLGGQAPTCRDFAVGHCRRGSQCRFLHDNGGRGEFERYKTHSREINLERGSYPGERDEIDCSRNKPLHRQRSHYDRERERPELHGDSRSTELCFDFTKGRCHRGSSCRYLHHEASSHGGWSVKDETRDDNYNRRGTDASSERTEPHRVNDAPCKFFAEGRCRRGHTCKFSHQADIVEAKLHARRWDYDQDTGDSLSKAASNFGNPKIDMDSSSHWDHGNDGGGSVACQSIEGENSKQKHQHEQPHVGSPTLHQEVDLKPDSQIQIHGVSGKHEQAKNIDMKQNPGSNEMLPKEGGSIISDRGAGKADINSVTSVIGQSFAQSRPSKFIAPQQMHPQTFAPGTQNPKVAPLSMNEQIHQVYPVPLDGQSQFVVPLTPSDAQHLNLTMHGQSGLSLPHAIKNQHIAPHNTHSQQNLNLSAQTTQFLLSPMIGKSLHNVQPNAHIHANNLPLNGLSTANIGFPGQSLQNPALPLTVHTQENPHMFATPKQNPSMESPSGNIFKSDNDQTSSQKIPGKAGASEMEQSPISPAQVISNKVVTSEQAARITDLSASLARFFGNAPLNVSTFGMPLSQHSSSSSAVLPATAVVAPPIQPIQDGAISGNLVPVKLEITNLVDPKMESHVSGTDPLGKNKNNDTKPIELGDPTKGNGTGMREQGKNEDKAHLEDGDAGGDGDNRQSKDAKGNKMFKFALVEFVKDLLKPAWKEGQLNREAHKTIVKKVVDKVTGSVQSPNIPQTQEKIDIYLAHSKPKLSKLVQAYVEKYVKN
ncbi:zinc finger CCCH domain-containing protein 55-like isoform X2 [Zingiber officinale]|uniref:zinc finger CCCH domain-containing protein 55-like isoform X2 n=1 Tax=Zingiber officinale TaxID=94328 RepID=UPI001C4B98D1|nr:zinc finger CCCH domain-containing protein 55-like isoform X2 [Zingiber officinale]